MRLTINQLKRLIESSLTNEDDAVNTDDADESFLSKDKIDFKIDFEGEEYEIEFFEDKNTKELQYSVDGNIPSKKSIQNFVTLASIGSLGQNSEIKDDLVKIVKIDKSLKQYSFERIKDIIKQKIKTERPGLTKKDIRGALGI